MGTTISDVIIIGSGLAGGFTAYAFAKRGVRVTVLESDPAVSSKASGNRFALLTPYITTKGSPLETLYSAGFCFTRSLYLNHPRLVPLFTQCGALQLPATSRLAASLEGDTHILGGLSVTRLTAPEASDVCGVSLRSAAFHIPEAGFVDPRASLLSLFDEYSKYISVRAHTHVTQLTQQDSGWCVTCSGGEQYQSPTVVLCNAYEAASLKLSSWLPLEAIRGQTVWTKASAPSDALRCVVAFGGYVTPAVQGHHLVGAHYRHNDQNPTVSDSDTAEILRRLMEWIPAMRCTRSDTTAARVCFRTSTIDRLPYIGVLPNFDEMQRESTRYQPGTNLARHVPLTHHRGLYIHAGHGSRGLLTCPLGGEIIARHVCGEELTEWSAVISLSTPDRLPHRLL